jgi:hypothetical protein
MWHLFFNAVLIIFSESKCDTSSTHWSDHLRGQFQHISVCGYRSLHCRISLWDFGRRFRPLEGLKASELSPRRNILFFVSSGDANILLLDIG